MQRWLFLFLVMLAIINLSACATTAQPQALQQAKNSFNEGEFKQAFCQLLPLAAKGNPEAQYAVGYMYYYGYGVAQDDASGLFWLKQASAQGWQPAKLALERIQQYSAPASSH